MPNLIVEIAEIPESKVARTTERHLAYRPNTEMIDDPNWIDPEDGESVAPQTLKYTTKQWVGKGIEDWLRACDRKGKKIIAEQAVIDNTDMFEE